MSGAKAKVCLDTCRETTGIVADAFGCSLDMGCWYLPELHERTEVRHESTSMTSAQHLGKGKRHVVTGGLSGIGQLIGCWCVDASLGSDLGLLGRTGKSKTHPQELHKGDMNVCMVRCDVSVREEASWWMMERLDHPYPLGMLVHAAGLLSSASLGLQTCSGLRSCVSPKATFLFSARTNN